MISSHITVKIYMKKMNCKTLGPRDPQPPLNEAPDMKARSYSLALCGLDVGAWKRHSTVVFRSQIVETPPFLKMWEIALPPPGIDAPGYGHWI